MSDVKSKFLESLRERHFYVPMTDFEMQTLTRIKKETGKAKSFFVREAILEKLDREGMK